MKHRKGECSCGNPDDASTYWGAASRGILVNELNESSKGERSESFGAATVRGLSVSPTEEIYRLISTILSPTVNTVVSAPRSRCMMETELSGRSIVVTGASAGIGAATARRVASAGANVVLAARREERLEELADEIEVAYGVTALVQPTDVTDSDAVGALIGAAAEHLDGIDGVVANAGVGRGAEVAEMSDEQYRTMMSVNVDGAFFAAREAIPHLVDSGGDLVFVGSFAGQYPRPGNPVYAATKWWVRGFARSLSAQEPDVGVTVLNPAEVRSEFGSKDQAPASERWGPDEASSPEEVADAIAFALGQAGSTVAQVDLYRDGKMGDEFF